MKALKMALSERPYLSTADISSIMGISKESSRVTASRYVKKGILIRLKRDMYISAERFKRLEDEDLFQIANLIQTPSYVSLTSALSYRGVSTQQQQNFVESVALKRAKKVVVYSYTFTFNLLKESLYIGFERTHDFFMATAEKALIDAVYLASLGRYTIDLHAIDFDRVDRNEIQHYIDRTNRVTKSYWGKICERFGI